MAKKEEGFEDKFLGLDKVADDSVTVAVKATKIKKPKKIPRAKKSRNRKNLPRVFGIISLTLLIIILVLLLCSGILKLPVLSQLFYWSPSPSRVVAEVVPGEIDRTKNGVDFNKDSGVLSVKISEEYLSYFLREVQLKLAEPRFDQNIQAIIEDGQIEFYGTILRPIKTEITIRVKPNVDSGLSLTKFFKVTKFKVGNLRLPSFTVELFLKEYLESKLKALTSAFGATGGLVSINPTFGIQNITLENGFAVVDIYFDLARIQENMKQLPQLIEEIQKRYPTTQPPIIQP